MANETQYPEITFSTFILSLASSALVQLGEVPDPNTGKINPDKDLAKHSIDTISMLRQKFIEGLTEQEKGMLDSLLYELKMKFVCKK